MSLPEYPEVKDIDDIVGFTAARKRAEERERNAAIFNNNEAEFIPYRVFLNQVDTYNAKHISSFLTDQIFGSSKKGRSDEEGEGEEEMTMSEAEPKQVKVERPQMKYEIIGSLNKSFSEKSEDILAIVKESDKNFIETIMKCGFVVYDITNDPREIQKALATLSAIDNEIEKIKAIGPKTFKNFDEIRVFILISTVMTWTFTKPIDPDDPELPFTETDYKKRKPHPNYRTHIDCEKEVIMTGRKNKDKLKTYVIASGIVYGAEEEDLFFLFKLAWNNEKELPIFRPGNNFVPLIHVKDLSKTLFGVIENSPSKPQYILAVEQTPTTLKQITKALSKAMGQGRCKDVDAEEAFLYAEMTQTLFERYTVNLNMEPGYIVEELEIEWTNELNLMENMKNIVNEFKISRGLKPLKIIVHGPPAVGKTRIAKRLAEHFGVHYLAVKTVIEDGLADLRDTIERQKAKIQAKEEKERLKEERIEDAEDDEASEEEEEDVDMQELEEQIKEIEDAIAESDNGKLPDDQINRLIKDFLSSNKCQNQGYVMDGYPKTIEQAKELFGVAEGGEEETEEEEGGGGGVANKLLPDFVISLEATDQFLCERIMELPEKQIQGTHYTEENMLRRLAEFRARNTEDNTPLNFFDEIEIHPIVLDAMQDATVNMCYILGAILNRLPNVVTFAPTPDEQEELMRLEEEKQKLKERESKLQREMAEKQAIDGYHSNMERWTTILEQLQMEEEKLLLVQSEPLRHYLIRFVFPVLSRGLLEVARIKPDDPVDFLAEYLFKENPEGNMFDPAYTREGKKIINDYQQLAEEDFKALASSEGETTYKLMSGEGD